MKKTKTLYYISFIGLFIFISFLRIWRLDSVPLSMHIDEAGLGLNAWSIANFGTDRYGHFMPVCPSNFYGEQSAFYTYFCAFLVKCFGLNIFTLRLPGAIMGIVTVVFGSLLFKEKWGDKGLFTGMLLMGIFPFFVMNCRFALDCNAMLGALTVALYSLVRLLKKVKDNPIGTYYGWFALTGFLFSVVLYTYIIAAIVIFIFCVLFGIYYLFHRKENRALRFRQLLFMALPLCVMVIPLVLVVCVNYFNLNPIETPFFSIPKMIENRTTEVAFSLQTLPSKIKRLVNTLIGDGMYGSSAHYFTMYLWSIPFVILGCVFSVLQSVKDIKNRHLSLDICLLFVCVGEVIMFILCGLYNYHINGIFIALAYFCVYGILHLFSLLKKRSLQIACTVLLSSLYVYSFAGFTGEYFFPKETPVYQVYGGVDEALSLLTQEQQKQDIYVLDEVADFYFMSNPISPEEFVSYCDELGYVKDYQNLHFYEPDQYSANHIYICTKTSGRHQTLLDGSVTGYEATCMETEHYYVIFASP